MKKRLLILVGFLLYFTITQAQEPQSEHKLFVGTAAASELSDISARDSVTVNFQFQIGGALRFTEKTSINATPADADDNPPKNMSFGFPFGVFYIPPTFISDKFEVSKGYFSNGVNIKWQIGANQDNIKSIDIYRRLLTDPKEGESEPLFELIASVSPTTFQYIDAQVDGGVLFEYQIRAIGVPITTGLLGQRTINYMDGIGYRNPTATVSGGVTFDSGSPVEEVTVFAEPVGAENRIGKSVKFTKDTSGLFVIEDITNLPANNVTLQAWVMANEGHTGIFRMQSERYGYHIYFGKTSNNLLGFIVYHNNGSYRLQLRTKYPTGELDAAGNDILKPISEIRSDEFIHISIVLEEGKLPRHYINGRELSAAYAQEYPDDISYDSSLTDSAIHTVLPNEEFNRILVSNSNRNACIDEFRAWNKALTAEEIRRDYRRSLGGGENGFAIYLRMDEGAGNFLYDLSKVGFNQNKNDAELRNVYSFSDTKPTSKQLGIFGVTDKNGSYIISGIPYKGTGESFLITPSLGVHEFEPASQTLFLGAEEPVVNQVNFKDISSFTFRGRVVYNVQDVFNPIETTNPTDLTEGAYNQYLDGTTKINKGEYYYEDGEIDPGNGKYRNGTLKKYPVLGVAGANVLIDGNVVFDADNQPILTDVNGNFEISVPIGNHKVEVKKDGHTFELNGRFPETNTFSFFEDQIETRYFIDNTRVTLVGKVVGGKTEFEKPIGFGANGLFEIVSNEDESNEVIETVSSVNNIGVAQITFKGTVDNNSLDKIIVTNSETGEYSVDLVPFQYTILSSTGTNKGITVASNPAINSGFLQESVVLDLREIPQTQKNEFTASDGKVYESESFHYERSFRYNSDVSLTFLRQTYENEIRLGNNTIDISNLSIPIYNQRASYNIFFEVSQKYINKDNSSDIITSREIFTDGNFSITNNLAASNSEQIALVQNGTEYKYSFTAGLPNISRTDGFKKEINVQYIIPGQNPLTIENNNDFKNEGIVKGASPTNGTAFSTVAPEIPDIILRDPPGSNSFASIEKGSTISYETTKTDTSNDAIGGGYYVSIGPTWEVSVGFVSVFTGTETNIVADTEGNFSTTETNTKENTTSNTYTFNQTISTSDEIEFVGAEGDLYIGNAKNVYYGIIDNMHITGSIPLDNNGTTIPNIEIQGLDEEGNNVTLYVCTSKGYFIGEQPTNTFFTYSQKYIVDTLIPDLEELAATLTAGNTPNSSENYQSPQFYMNQANLWRKVIQNNEKSKYDALNRKNALQNEVLANVSGFGNYENNLRDLIRDNFFSNRSFDAGVGEITNAVSTLKVSQNTIESSIDVSQDFKAQLGLLVNNIGAIGNFTKSSSKSETDTNTSVNEESVTISYTLKDNDRDNVLSVDVINLFDGNGPVFVTKGGATSCPYEGETKSVFFKNSGFNQNVIGVGGETLSTATNRVYKPEITVDKTLISNVPESEAAIFNLRLKNVSQTQTDLEFVLDVDPLSLNGATTNIEPGGLTIFLPFNETIDFPLEISKSSSSSVFTYNNITVFLASPCDVQKAESEDFVDLSVEFKKSCSNVSLSAPENNWIFNSNEAYSVDVNGDVSSNKLPITFTDFNTDFNGFEKITLQYRNVNQTNWNKLQTYYGSEILKNDAGDTSGIVIKSSDADFTFNWDIIGDDIADGRYEFRAVTFCTDNISNTSEIIGGVINLTAPVVFGTPKPTDGILDVGEDVSLRFNEPIFQNITTEIKVTGLKNQQDIKHDVSVKLDGSTKQIELPNQQLKQASSLTLQFWYKPTSGTGTLVSQENGFNVTIKGNQLEFSMDGEIIETDAIPITLNRFNFYSFVYQKSSSFSKAQLLIIENGDLLKQKELASDIDINTNASIFIGGQNVVGNIHDVRMWTQTFTPAQATVAKDLTLTGRELNLTGYWKLDEGFGNTALDKAKRRNAIVNLDWEINPTGTAYEFKNNSYLALENVNSVQISNLEDITLSFWIKPDGLNAGTIFSNGFGDDKEIVLTNGFRNKWSVNMNAAGGLELQAEDAIYSLTNAALTNQKWTHVALILKRGGTLKSFIDGEEKTSVSSILLGGLTGNKFLLGARLYEDVSNVETIDNHYTGLLDEVRLWNTARSIAQVKRDRYFEIDKETAGLMLYTDFNEDANNKTSGPAYNHADINETIGTTFAILQGTTQQSYAQDSPALKPKLEFTNIPFSTVINGDEMIIQPNLTDEEWALFEGEIINFSVRRLSDTHFNTQLSPVTWSALVNRQELQWFTENKTKEIVAKKNVGETYSFTMTIDNIGGSNQTYEIFGLPVWMNTENTSGTVPPNTFREITFTVDKDLAMGNYSADLFLQTNAGFNDRLNFNLRVLQAAPDWSVNPREYDYSINIIGQIQIEGTLSRDIYTKVGAFVNNEKRGEALLTYDAIYDSYFVFLTAYSNIPSGETITFKIWDAINGKSLIANIDNVASIPFLKNQILGIKSSPKIFSGDILTEQSLTLSEGWTWTSFFVDDSRFTNIPSLLTDLANFEEATILNDVNNTYVERGSWKGTLNTLVASEMYKIKLSEPYELKLSGNQVDETAINFNILQGWNWLPFPIHKNVSLEEALAFFDPTDGDVIKDQFNFAIYDASSGWSGTLDYLITDEGYMLRSGKAQTFNYPNSQSTFAKSIQSKAAKSNRDQSFRKYQNNMNIVAEIDTDAVFDTVVVIDENGVVRGSSPITNVNGKYMSFITAFSDEIESLQFVLKDSNDEIKTGTKVSFSNNLVLGNLKEPFKISLKSLDSDTFNIYSFAVYPNPFSNTIKVDFSAKTQAKTLEIYNVLGVLVAKQNVLGLTTTSINGSNLVAGVYTLKVTSIEGNTVVKKIVKD